MFLVTPRGKTWKRRIANFWGLSAKMETKAPASFFFQEHQKSQRMRFTSSDQRSRAQAHFCIIPTNIWNTKSTRFYGWSPCAFYAIYYRTVHPSAKLSYHQSNLATNYAHFKLFRIITNLFFNVITQHAKCWGTCHVRLLLVSLSHVVAVSYCSLALLHPHISFKSFVSYVLAVNAPVLQWETTPSSHL